MPRRAQRPIAPALTSKSNDDARHGHPAVCPGRHHASSAIIGPHDTGKGDVGAFAAAMVMDQRQDFWSVLGLENDAGKCNTSETNPKG